MSFSRYERYKESGVEWLGEVPEGWEVLALKRVASLKSGESITAENIEEVGEYPVYGGNGLRGYTGAPTHEGHYALIGRQGALCGNINYAQGRFWASEHAVVVSPVKQVETFWLGELLRAMNLNQYSVSAAQPGLSVEIVNNLQIPLPPLSDQQTIAAFLDRETGKIDVLVAEQERLIGLLKEKRQATISHAVTKGLNPAAPLKASGIEWLGEVPEGWIQTPIKHTLLGLIDTEHKTAPFYEDGEYLVVRTTNIKDGKLTLEGAKYTDLEGFVEWTKRGKPEPGDIMFTREAPAGEACLVPDNFSLCMGQRTVLMRVNHKVLDSNFGLWSIYGGVSSEFVTQLSQGSTVTHFNMSDIGNIPLLLPPKSEQAVIAAFLDSETAKIDTLVGEARQVISLLKERRSALISAAVTGKIDVRHLEVA